MWFYALLLQKLLNGLYSKVKPCADYNNGNCNKKFIHDNDMIHMCIICELMFGAGFFHPANACELLGRLDSGLLEVPNVSLEEKSSPWIKFKLDKFEL